MNKRLVILGTNEYQNPLILRAKELGYETHVFAWPVGEIGEKTADFYYPINIFDVERIWEECVRIKPCGVAAIASEVCMPIMDVLLRRLGIPCNSIETEVLTTNKYEMRCALKKAGFIFPQFCLIDSSLTQENIQTIKGFSFPLIAKPTDSSSSRGIQMIHDLDELENAILYAMSFSKSKRILIEEYVNGQEYSGESIAYEGKYKLLAVTQKTTTGEPHFVETGHLQPARIDLKTFRKIEENLYKAFAALGIEYGAIHPEFRITPSGEIVFMEIATRMGGDCIGSDLVPLSTGYDYMGMVISICCGEEPSFEKIREPGIAEIKYIMDSNDLNDLKSIKENRPQIIWRESEMKPFSENEIQKSADRAGYYITVRTD